MKRKKVTKRSVPEVGDLVRPVGREILYRVVRCSPYGCSVEAVSDEYTPVDGRQPRKLHYSEKRASLTVSSQDGTLFDDRWRAWERVN